MGKFRSFFEALNPQMYDLTTPEGKQEYQRDLADLTRYQSRPALQVVKRQPHRQWRTFICWNGCSPEHLERLTVERGQGYRVLDGQRSRSRAIWFTQNEELARSRSDGVLIRYPLLVPVYFDSITYANGETVQEPSQQMMAKVQAYVECPYSVIGNVVVELPQGWTFSEERHILCEGAVRVRDDMIWTI
jgi:hypothetical protein